MAQRRGDLRLRWGEGVGKGGESSESLLSPIFIADPPDADVGGAPGFERGLRPPCLLLFFWP